MRIRDAVTRAVDKLIKPELLGLARGGDGALVELLTKSS
jgi:hypothetical protein